MIYFIQILICPGGIINDQEGGGQTIKNSKRYSFGKTEP